MSNINLDQKYSLLVDELAKLNSKFRLFINGDADVKISTDVGLIKSISGIKKDLESFRYVQRIINHKLYADMIADDVNIEAGMLIRVWGDTPANNGIFRKDADNTYIKVSYQDIYDLRDSLPDPWNYYHFKFDETDTAANKKLISFSLPISAVNTNDVLLKGTLKYTTSGTGLRGSYSTKFHLLITVGNTTEKIFNYQPVFSQLNTIDPDLYQTTPSVLKAVFNTTVDSHEVSVWFVPAKDILDNIIPGKLELSFEGIDTKLIKILTDSAEVDTSPDLTITPNDQDLTLYYQSLVV